MRSRISQLYRRLSAYRQNNLARQSSYSLIPRTRTLDGSLEVIEVGVTIGNGLSDQLSE